MARYTKAEIRDRVKSLDTMKKQRTQLEKKIKAIEVELLGMSADDTITLGADDWGFKNVKQANWQSFNKGRAALDFGIADFPQIYEPSYKLTKELLNQLNAKDAGDTELVNQYCGTSNQIRIIHPGE